MTRRSLKRTRRSIARSRAFAAAADFVPRSRAEVSKIAPPPPRSRPRVAPGSVRIRRRRASRLRTQDHGGWVMLRTMMIALFATASVAMLAPDAASARGGFGGGGGGFRGGGGGFPRRWRRVLAAASAAAGWEWAARVSGLLGSAAAVSVRPRSEAVVSVRPLCRLPDFAAARLPSTVSTVASTAASGTGDFRLLWRQSD